jgi:hypothetical protein
MPDRASRNSARSGIWRAGFRRLGAAAPPP